MQDSIIVYRNPLEKAIWESNVLPIAIMFAVVMGVVFFLVYKSLEKITGKTWKQPDWFMWVSGIASLASAVACYFLIYR